MKGYGPKLAYPIENVSGEDIPPHSVVLVTGVETSSDNSQTWSTVTKYDGSAGNIMVTGNVTIRASMTDSTGATVNGRGTAYFDGFLYVAVDSGISLRSGVQLGPVSGSWKLGNGRGFTAQGAAVDGRALFWRDEKGCDCCPPCCGTLWYVTGDVIQWTADFYEGVTDSELDNWYSPGGPRPYVNACDVDSNGNVYQCAIRSRKLVTSLSKPQPAMYSLKSYDSAGNLNWSWAKYPQGFVSGSVRDTDYGTTKVRCGGANVFTTYASLTDSDCHLRKHSTTDGTPIWDINATQVETSFGDISYMVSAGPTRILFTSGSAISDGYPVVVLDHSGAFVWGEQTNSYFMPVWIDDDDKTYMISLVSGGSAAGTGTTTSGDAVAVFDADGTPIDTPVIRDGFQPVRLRTWGDLCAVSNGTEVRLYTIGGTGNYTHKITSAELLMVLSDRVGTKTEFVTRLRSTTDLSAAYFFYPPTALSLGDDYLFADAMPFEGGTVWCGRRVCGKTLEPDTDTPTTTSTTTTSTSTTTGSTTTASTTSTTTASTTTSSTTTASTTTGSTTTSSTTTESTTTASTTTGSTTTGSTSSTTAACTGTCDYIGNGTGTGSPTGFYWAISGNNCSPSCSSCLTGGASELATIIGRWPADAMDFASVSCV